ncbi:MAG: hypothetical protein AAFO04_18655 [Cyanobacteria bacterium J06592_8]
MNQFKRQSTNHSAHIRQDSDIRMAVIPILDHADVPSGFVEKSDETTMLSLFHVFNLDRILLEFTAIVRELSDPERDLQYQLATSTEWATEKNL